jgi:hypothetical protein
MVGRYFFAVSYASIAAIPLQLCRVKVTGTAE